MKSMSQCEGGLVCQCQRQAASPALPLMSGGLSALTLVLMPKCPACMAAYVAVGTGIGLGSVSAAALRHGLIIFCSAILLLAVLRLAMSRLSKAPSIPPASTPVL